MQISVTEAKAQLTDLVRRAEAGDEVVLTRHGQPAVRLVPVRARPDAAARRALVDAVRAGAVRAGAGQAGAVQAGAGQAFPHSDPGSDAAHSQDYLYGDDGLPQ